MISQPPTPTGRAVAGDVLSDAFRRQLVQRKRWHSSSRSAGNWCARGAGAAKATGSCCGADGLTHVELIRLTARLLTPFSHGVQSRTATPIHHYQLGRAPPHLGYIADLAGFVQISSQLGVFAVVLGNSQHVWCPTESVHPQNDSHRNVNARSPPVGARSIVGTARRGWGWQGA